MSDSELGPADFKAALLSLRLAFSAPAQPCPDVVCTPLPVWELFGCTRNERAHTNTLRWLFDPTESHGLRGAFLRGFYRRVFARTPTDTDRAVARSEVQLKDDRIDLLLYGPDWRLVIENKIDDQDVGQCERYERRWPGSDFVYLTPTGRRPDCGELFKPVSFRVIREVLDDLYFRQAGTDFVRCFADHIAWDLNA